MRRVWMTVGMVLGLALLGCGDEKGRRVELQPDADAEAGVLQPDFDGGAQDGALDDAQLAMDGDALDAQPDAALPCDLTRDDGEVARYRRFLFERSVAEGERAIRCAAYASPDALTVLTDDARQSACGVIEPALAAGRMRFDQEGAAACLTLLREATCLTAVPYACYRELVGAVAEGQPCYLGNGRLECAPGLYCDVSSSCPGTCKPRIPVGQPATAPCVESAYEVNGTCEPTVPEGQSCAPLQAGASQRACHDSLCEPETLICRRPMPVGADEPCGGSRTCAVGLSCVNEVCVPLGHAGDPCRHSGQCQYDLTCAPDSQTCRAPGDEGASCDSAFDCKRPLDCHEEASGEGHCAHPKQQGEACLDVWQCAPELACMGMVDGLGTCSPTLGKGSPCTHETQCTHPLYCTIAPQGAGECAERKPAGEPCSWFTECQSGICDLESGRCACYDPALAGT